jgi:hypothetical protein
LVNVNINIEGISGGIAGTNRGTIQNCYVSGSIRAVRDIDTGQRGSVGGIAGVNEGGIIENCYTTCDVIADSEQYNYEGIGGIAGRNTNWGSTGGIIRWSYATGRVTGTRRVGGIVGVNSEGSTVSNCVAVNREIQGGYNMGTIPWIPFVWVNRIAGSNSGTLSNNYARTGITGTAPNSGTLTSEGGANVAASDYDGANARNWWFNIGYIRTHWSQANGRLPFLFQTTGAAFNQEQNPTVQP